MSGPTSSTVLQGFAPRVSADAAHSRSEAGRSLAWPGFWPRDGRRRAVLEAGRRERAHRHIQSVQMPAKLSAELTSKGGHDNMFAKVVTNASKPKEAMGWAETEIKRMFSRPPSNLI